MHLPLAATAIALLPAAPAAGAAPAPQDDDPAAVRAHLALVRDRRIPAEDKLSAMRALLEAGPNARYQLAFHLGRECAHLEKRFTPKSEAIAADFDRAAGELVLERLDRSTREEVALLQARVTALAADANLDKGAITRRSDPAMERLGELLTVHPNDVYDHSEGLFADLEDMLDNLEERKVLADHWHLARKRLDDDRSLRTRVARLAAPSDPRAQEDTLYTRLEWLALLATPMEKADRLALAANRELRGRLDAQELSGVARLNARRIHAGLGAVRIDVRLGEASRGHSQDMVEHGFFSHSSPVAGKETFGQRARLAGTSASAENIAAGHDSGEGAIRAWWYSPGHHRNMMAAGHRRIGLGRCEATWTMMLGG